MPPSLRTACACAIVVQVAACAQRVPLPAAERPVEFDRPITFYQHPLAVHFARPGQVQPGTPLLLYATGDGGWRGKDRDAFRHMMRWGYPVAGFSAPSYLSHLGYESGTTTPMRLARDYGRLIEFAKEVLGLADATPTILVGVSRGAGLAVVAASRSVVRERLAGVLAVALTKEEEYVRHYKVRRGRSPADMPTRELVTFDTYEALADLRELPLVVIQSTHDNYLPAADARRLFGPDTDLRQLHAVAARNHSFGGARDALYELMASSLAWIRDLDRERSAKASSLTTR